MSASQPAHQYELLIERNFPVAREQVFKAWTDERQLAQWFGPRGFTNPTCIFDPRPGGGIHIEMRGPDGTLYPMRGEVKEIFQPERLVFSAHVPDKDGEPIFEMQDTVTCIEAPGGTLLAWHTKLLNAKLEAAPYISGHEQGCRQTLERLSEYLATHPK